MQNPLKPQKPYPGFPLTAHRNGQWCKKIRRKVFYFGPIADWQTALATYLEQKDDLHAGRTPRARHDVLNLGEAMDRFLSGKKLAQEAGEIRDRTYNEYEAICDRISDSLGSSRWLDDTDETDLAKLRADFTKGKNGTRGPGTVKGDVIRARMVFLYINEYLTEKPIRYRKALKAPSRTLLRAVANERGERLFTATEIRSMLKAASVQLRAMIYLGINCGFGNNDCGTLPLARLDLKTGWHDYWRPKTHNPRRCPLWPETIKAIQAAIDERPDNETGLVFVTKYGNSWADTGDRNSPVSYEFRKVLKNLGIYRNRVTSFYSLRRTFETIGQTTKDQVAVDFIMGHIAPSNNMAAVYRQKVFDDQLTNVTNHVRAWLKGRRKIV
jgi:integrase